jgi:hypothetical protein
MKHIKTFESFNISSDEILEEGIRDFFRGGTKEEIAAKEVGVNARLDEIEKIIEEKKLPVEFQDYGDNKRYPYTREALLKLIAKNNYLGTIETHVKGGKLILLYRAGNKGMNALAAASAEASGMSNKAKNPN